MASSGRQLLAALTVAASVAAITAATSAAATSRSERAPAACTRAIADARTIGALAAQGFDKAAQWPALLSRLITAIQASSVSQMNGILRDATALNQAVTNLAPRMRSAANRFNADAAGCT